MTGKQQKTPGEEEVSQEEVVVELVPEENTQTEETMDEAAAKAPETEVTNDGNADQEVTIELLTEQMEALKMAAADNMDKAVRAQAELENVRKRTHRDIQNAHKYALEKFINELLPVLDSMELGISASEEAQDICSLREGMELTMKMFVSSLEKSGINQVDPRKGDKFNPDLHEAVTVQEIDDVESGTVISVMQKGYELNGRLIRPAMVIVAK